MSKDMCYYITEKIKTTDRRAEAEEDDFRFFLIIKNCMNNGLS